MSKYILSSQQLFLNFSKFIPYYVFILCGFIVLNTIVIMVLRYGQRERVLEGYWLWNRITIMYMLFDHVMTSLYALHALPLASHALPSIVVEERLETRDPLFSPFFS
jgi:hypothetical protein